MQSYRRGRGKNVKVCFKVLTVFFEDSFFFYFRKFFEKNMLRDSVVPGGSDFFFPSKKMPFSSFPILIRLCYHCVMSTRRGRRDAIFFSNRIPKLRCSTKKLFYIFFLSRKQKKQVFSDGNYTTKRKAKGLL